MQLRSLALFLVLCAAPAAAQPEPPIHVPPIEVAAGLSIEHDGAGPLAQISGNLTKTIAVTSEIATSAGGTTVLAGARAGTAFWYDGKPPAAGRFFAQLLANRSLVQPGVGADVMVLPHMGMSLHWCLDYRFAPGGDSRQSGTRLVVGVLFGPRAWGGRAHDGGPRTDQRSAPNGSSGSSSSNGADGSSRL